MTAVHDDAQAIRALLAELVRYALRDDGADAERHAAAARDMQAAMRARFGGSIPASLNFNSLWVLAIDDAERDPTVLDHSGVSLTLQRQLPFEPSLLFEDPFDPEALRLRIRGAAATG